LGIGDWGQGGRGVRGNGTISSLIKGKGLDIQVDANELDIRYHP